MRLRIFVAGHQPGTAASSAPGCPPEAETQEEEKGGGDAPALAFGNNSLWHLLQAKAVSFGKGQWKLCKL